MRLRQALHNCKIALPSTTTILYFDYYDYGGVWMLLGGFFDAPHAKAH
jgi:hypothetical protein